MKKKYLPGILIPIMLLLELTVFSQTPINYQYDLTGNRKYRKIVTLKSGTIEPTNAVQVDTTYFKPQEFKEDMGETQIKIYPNPTRGQLRIEVTGFDFSNETMVQLYNMSGTLIFTKKPLTGMDIIDLSSNSIGMYVLKIKLGDKLSEWQIIKE